MKNISQKLSYLLRHNPETLIMDENGYVFVDELLNYVQIFKTDLDYIVESNNKKRFSYSEDGKKIRASQGHTIPGLTINMQIVKPVDILYHGTSEDSYVKIKDSGHIDKMERHYVHLTDDIDTAYAVGKRYSKNDKPTILKINARQMYDDGFIFKLSDNNVYQVELVPIKYIIKINR